ncbi:hypothetical protein M3231_15205 [Neobacillus mesonae]|nr:hypothetical protein [Neobacillus mesonae]
MAGKDVTVRINVDVSEALTGLKAIQREAKKATQALREYEAVLHAGEYVMTQEQYAQLMAATQREMGVTPTEFQINTPSDIVRITCALHRQLREVRD